MINQTVNPAEPGPDAPKHIKVPLSQLPDAKEGDCYTVASIDTSSGMATLMPESSPEVEAAMPDADEKDAEASPAEEDEESDKPNLNTKTLLGPMDGLKNYLVQKSMDVPKNASR